MPTDAFPIFAAPPRCDFSSRRTTPFLPTRIGSGPQTFFELNFFTPGAPSLAIQQAEFFLPQKSCRRYNPNNLEDPTSGNYFEWLCGKSGSIRMPWPPPPPNPINLQRIKINHSYLKRALIWLLNGSTCPMISSFLSLGGSDIFGTHFRGSEAFLERFPHNFRRYTPPMSTVFFFSSRFPITQFLELPRCLDSRLQRFWSLVHFFLFSGLRTSSSGLPTISKSCISNTAPDAAFFFFLRKPILSVASPHP